jgi:sugar lactone lactonase YvrE
VTRATQVTERCTYHGEGPYWDREAGRLLLVDMLAGAIVELDAEQRPVRHEYGGVAAVIRRRSTGGLVLADEHGYRFLTDDLSAAGDAVTVFDDPAIRMNEGGCDPQGRLYLGTMAYGATEGAGTMYRIDPDSSVHEVLHGVTISNGLQWRADGQVAFYNDTTTHRISQYAFDAVAGTFGERTTVVDIPERSGNPDGLAIDTEGGLWCALYGGSAVHRYDQDGRLTEVVELPVRDVTSCTFGGPDLSTLFITTSRDGWGEEHAEPQAGAVFAVETSVHGAVQYDFAG